MLTNIGAGNSFLGGLAAGLTLGDGDVYDGTWSKLRACARSRTHLIHFLSDELVQRWSAAFFATISASYTIEQHGLPRITRPSSDVLSEEWNGDSPWRRLEELKARCANNSK